MLNEFYSLSPFPTLLLQITDLQSEHLMSVWVTGRSGRHHTLLRHRCPGKETSKEVANSFWDADSSQRGENALCCLTSKSHLILDTFVPFPPLTSLILTHHLNKEVRAMIKSSHSVNRVARQMLDPTLVRDSPLRQTTHVFFLLLHHCSSQLTLPVSGGAKSPCRSTSVAPSCFICRL